MDYRALVISQKIVFFITTAVRISNPVDILSLVLRKQ
jgi:hypothetical protein